MSYSSCHMQLLWKNIRSLFPIFNNHPHLIYTDNASTVHKPQSVLDSMDSYMTHQYANIHRGQYDLAEQSELLYINSKKTVASFIWWDYREIVYTYNATYACNLLAQSLVFSGKVKTWDTVLVGIRDHHATIVTRQLLAQRYGFNIEFISIDKETLDIDRKWLQQILSQNKVKVVTCSHVSNVTGVIYDMSRVRWLLSDDIFFAIDGSQAVPHMKIDVKILWCHAYIFTGHKMMGPTGIWVLRIDKVSWRSLDAPFGWWGIIEQVTTAWCSLIRTVDKFEPGTPNLIGAIALAAACDFYTAHDLYAVLPSYERDLSSYLTSLLSQNKKITIIWQHSPCERGGIVSFAMDDMERYVDLLANNGICVRAGGHCAHPLLHHLGHEKWVIRISVFAYNTREEMEKIAKLLAE